jgi:hypothetical protein
MRSIVHERPTGVGDVHRARTSDYDHGESRARKCDLRASSLVDFALLLSCSFDCAHYDVDRSNWIASYQKCPPKNSEKG